MRKIAKQRAGTPSYPGFRTEDEAAQVLWSYYRQHKAELAVDIRKSRTVILAQLVEGRDPKEVFGAFPREVTLPARIPPLRTPGTPKRRLPPH